MSTSVLPPPNRARRRAEQAALQNRARREQLRSQLARIQACQQAGLPERCSPSQLFKRDARAQLLEGMLLPPRQRSSS